MPTQPSAQREPASFRDPSGFIYRDGTAIYRQINRLAAKDYDLLMQSGLYTQLVAEKLLIPHEEINHPSPWPDNHYKTIKPELIPFISYPYEWSFSQLKEAALATLAIQEKALALGLSLKDASAYNIQFIGSQPVFIDTLSFEPYEEGRPWVAYRQFCQHFLAPLALMAYVDLRLGTLSRQYIDGIPLDLAIKLLPRRSRFKPGIAAHIHFHAMSQIRMSASQRPGVTYRLSKTHLLGLIDSLEGTIRKLKPHGDKTEWGNYYDQTNYTNESTEAKHSIINDWLGQLKPRLVFDLGANNGEFSRLAEAGGAYVVASDIDPVAVEKNYVRAAAENSRTLLPLVINLTNPSPALGWANEERAAFLQRQTADVVMCLALIHHLAISNNLPLESIAQLLQSLGSTLIIEFVPKSDSNTQRLLSTREDIFTNYTKTGFEAAFSQYFTIETEKKIPKSQRILYLMKREKTS